MWVPRVSGCGVYRDLGSRGLGFRGLEPKFPFPGWKTVRVSSLGAQVFVGLVVSAQKLSSKERPMACGFRIVLAASTSCASLHGKSTQVHTQNIAQSDSPCVLSSHESHVIEHSRDMMTTDSRIAGQPRHVDDVVYMTCPCT